jgi:hypothetical protein
MDFRASADGIEEEWIHWMHRILHGVPVQYQWDSSPVNRVKPESEISSSVTRE